MKVREILVNFQVAVEKHPKFKHDKKGIYMPSTHKIYKKALSDIQKLIPKKENMYNECETQYCLGYDTGYNQAIDNINKKLK